MVVKVGILVILFDGFKCNNVVVNVMLNNFEFGMQFFEVLFKVMGGKGNIVKFFYFVYLGVYQCEFGFDVMLKKYFDIKIIVDYFVKVLGLVDDGCVVMENIFCQYGDKIDGVWVVFDDLGIGVEFVIEFEFFKLKLIIMGIDGNVQVVDMIKLCMYYKVIFCQDFLKMVMFGVEQFDKILKGGKVDSDEMYVLVVMLMFEMLGVKCF